MARLFVGRQTQHMPGRLLVLLILVLGLVAAACGGDGDVAAPDDADATEEDVSADDDGEEAPADREPTVIEFAFAPDEVIDYMLDTGRLAEMEEEWGVSINMTDTFDEFTYFAGGHGDIVSTATYELPLLEQQTEIETVTFGQYSRAKMGLMVRSDSDYESLEDLVGEKVALGDPTGATLVWGAMAKEVYGLDFLFEGGDYDIVVNDHFTNPELVARGEVEACICPPNIAAAQLASGELRFLYEDAGTASEFFGEYIDPGHEGIMENVFTATKEWYDAHPYEVAFFLAVWEEGISMWEENREQIVNDYPEHFGIEGQESIDWMSDYLAENDWHASTAYLDDEWVESERSIYEIMKSTGGFMEEDAPEPTFDVVTPEEVEEQRQSGG